MTWRPPARAMLWMTVIALVVLFAFRYLAKDFLQPGTPWSRLQDRIEEFRTTAVLDRPLAAAGALFPARTRVRWDDPSHRRLSRASPPPDTEVLGVRAISFRRLPEAGWMVGLRGAQVIDGWLCTDGSDVELSATGRLEGCELQGAQTWRGWILPDHSRVWPRPDLHGVVLELPPVGAWDTPFDSPVVGRMPWITLFNEDGSPSSSTYGRQAPYVMAGQALSGEVRWEYDPATAGMGRERPPVSVSGSVREGEVLRHVSYPGRTGTGIGEGFRGRRHKAVLPCSDKWSNLEVRPG